MKKGVAFLILFLSGCSYFGGGGVGGGTSSNGLSLVFMTNLPPPVVYDADQLSFQLRLQNLGEEPVGGPGDRVYVSGFDHNIITGIPPGGVQIPSLAGRYVGLGASGSPESFIGDTDYVTFDNVVIRRIPADQYPVQMLATACYDYRTNVSGTVCLDPSPNVATLKSKVCHPRQISLLPHVAPVMVSSVVAEPRNGVTTFRFFVTNTGGGTVFRRGVEYLTRCSPYADRGLSYDEVDQVQVLDVSVGGQSLNCRALGAENHVRLNANAGVFTCDAPVTGNDAYTSPIKIVLAYGYRSQVATSFQVYRTP